MNRIIKLAHDGVEGNCPHSLNGTCNCLCKGCRPDLYESPNLLKSTDRE